MVQIHITAEMEIHSSSFSPLPFASTLTAECRDNSFVWYSEHFTCSILWGSKAPRCREATILSSVHQVSWPAKLYPRKKLQSYSEQSLFLHPQGVYYRQN